MADKKVKFGFGQKDGIDKAIQDGKLDNYDMVITTDTDEMAYIDSQGNKKFVKDRLDEDVQFKGTSIGNWADGSTAKEGLTFTEWLKKAAQKSIPATYTKPSVGIANNNGSAAGNVETGTSVTPKLRATFNKNDAGNLSSISIKKANQNVKEGKESPLDYTDEAIVIGDETVTFTASASYADGAIKNDNLGQPSPNGQIKAGTVNSSGYSFTGQRNSFWGSGVGKMESPTSDIIRKLANKRLNVTAGTKISMKVEKGQQHIMFVLPEPRTLTQVIYDDLGDKGMLSSFAKSTVQVADARGGQNGLKNYSCYLYNLATPCASSMNFTFVIG